MVANELSKIRPFLLMFNVYQYIVSKFEMEIENICSLKYVVLRIYKMKMR